MLVTATLWDCFLTCKVGLITPCLHEAVLLRIEGPVWEALSMVFGTHEVFD